MPKSLYGTYDGSSDIHVTGGCSKDYNPDPKQIVFGLGPTKDRIIIVGDVSQGNTSDKTWNKDILKELRGAIQTYGLPEFIYVADSAAVAEDALERLAGRQEEEVPITCPSRLPGISDLEKDFREKAVFTPEGWNESWYSERKQGISKVQ